MFSQPLGSPFEPLGPPLSSSVTALSDSASDLLFPCGLDHLVIETVGSTIQVLNLNLSSIFFMATQ